MPPPSKRLFFCIGAFTGPGPALYCIGLAAEFCTPGITGNLRFVLEPRLSLLAARKEVRLALCCMPMPTGEANGTPVCDTLCCIPLVKEP
jgi:hypothetical protein